MRNSQKIGTVASHRAFLRSVYAETLLEDFFVAAVASMLAIRLYLQATGYPQLTVGTFHIAHVLLGGLLMLAALIILLAFLNRFARELAAVIGGIGFGLFIDELGKFITSDNDYFFEPAVALIYVAFVLLFFSIRIIVGRQTLSQEECFANTFEIAKQASVTGLDQEERRVALELLQVCTGNDIAADLRAILLRMTPVPSSRSRFITRFQARLTQLYEYAATKWWFTGAIIGFFAFAAVTSLSTLVAIIQWSWALGLWTGGGAIILAALLWSRRIHVRYLNILVSVAIVIVSILMTWGILGSLMQKPLSLIDWAQFVFPSVSGFLVVIGLLLMPVSRLRAYGMFRRATLISIFLTQVLSFYQYQLLALVGLLINIVILLALRYLIGNEHAKLKSKLSEA